MAGGDEETVTVCDVELIAPRHLPPGIPSAAAGESSGAITLPLGVTVEEAEKTLILKTLASVGNNKARAAQVLGISVKTLHNKLHRYGT